MGIDEVIATGRGVVERAESERRRHSRHGHRRNPEQILSRQPDEEDREVHVGRIKLCLRHDEAPGHVGRIEEQQRERNHCQRERRGVEDVRVLPVSLPSQELLGDQADRHHHELPIEPRVLEPEKQRETENDGERTEAQCELAAMRPRQKAVEAVSEEQLRNDQRTPRDTPRASRSPNKASATPVSTPASSAAGAAPLRASPVCPRRRTPNSNALHAQQHERGAHDRGTYDRPCVQQRKLAQHQQAADERSVDENAPRADSRVLKVGAAAARDGGNRRGAGTVIGERDR